MWLSQYSFTFAKVCGETYGFKSYCAAEGFTKSAPPNFCSAPRPSLALLFGARRPKRPRAPSNPEEVAAGLTRRPPLNQGDNAGSP